MTSVSSFLIEILPNNIYNDDDEEEERNKFPLQWNHTAFPVSIFLYLFSLVFSLNCFLMLAPFDLCCCMLRCDMFRRDHGLACFSFGAGGLLFMNLDALLLHI